MKNRLFLAAMSMLAVTAALAADPSAAQRSFSGIYPHLAYFNNEGECGTGAVVPWAGRLWVITYGPHLPFGSSDKLYEIDESLAVAVRPESVGGTPANRMIHAESGQLLIGPYLIDTNRAVRVIPPPKMPGRLTGNARHLADPANKVYYATMEEGLYEVDVRTLDVTGLIKDGNGAKPGQTREARPAKISSQLPGYHGKGLYSGQGRVVYANNGERDPRVATDPTIPSGALAEWRGEGDWQMVRRNQFTEVAGPGGLSGNRNPATDPLWSVGWDHRSLILMLLDGGRWRAFRLPKATHTYDGSHGWNTEWPRIRDIGEKDLLMTMHGMFWRFPRGFGAANTAGIRPRSTYLKVIGDFCRWNDRIVLGCDDTAKSEFLNTRKAKGGIAGPGQSQSNLRFVAPGDLDGFGAPLGRGAVWLNDPVQAGRPSDAYLFAGWERRGAHLANGGDAAATIAFETDIDGRGEWKPLRSAAVPAGGYAWVEFPAGDAGEWIRATSDRDLSRLTVFFAYANADRRPPAADALFDGLAAAGESTCDGGLVRCRGDNLRTLALAARTLESRAVTDIGYYELDSAPALRRVEDAKALDYTKKNTAIPKGILSADAASVLYVDDSGRRWRLPKGDPAFDHLTGAGLLRITREIATERDLFNSHGAFYELPAENAGGFAKVRPVCTHNRLIMDYCTYRGVLVLTGVRGGEGNPHIVRSDDGRAAVWLGASDDLWRLGKAVGRGGPWKDTAAKAGEPSDPYLMTGYDSKKITLSHRAPEGRSVRVGVDITGSGDWALYRTFDVAAGAEVTHEFPPAFQAYWLRVAADRDCTATAWLEYR